MNDYRDHSDHCMLEMRPRGMGDAWHCAAECRVAQRKRWQAARAEALAWLREHEANVIDTLRACDDVNALRAVAKALGYEEGAK